MLFSKAKCLGQPGTVWINPLCTQTARHRPLFFLTTWPQTARQQPASRRSILVLASRLMQTGKGFLQDLWPRFHYCLLLPAMSLVQGSVEFERHWIFTVTSRWTYDGCTKMNKSPTVSNGIGASSFEIWTANLAQSLTVGTLTNSRRFKLETLQSRLPRRHPKTWHSDVDIADLGFFFFFMLSFRSEKNLNLLDTQEHCICKLGKIRSELKLLFDVYYWFSKL